MAEYLATARNPQGKKVTERLDVGSADEAVQALRDRGYDEIVLHTDDVAARYSNQAAVAKSISPGQYLLIRNLPPRLAGFLIVAGSLYRKNWIWYAAGLGLLAYRYWRRGMTWHATDGVLVFLLLFPAAFACLAQFIQGAAGRYRAMTDAVAWGRWEEVLARVDSVGGSVPPEEIAFQKAGALAGLGRIDAALRVVAPFADGKAMPAWRYWSRLAGVYSKGRLREDSKASLEEALELEPDNATLLVDKADSEVWLRRNPRLARELLDRARQHALSDIVGIFALKAEGLIRLEEGQPREARELLTQALNRLSALRHASPLIGASIDTVHAALALAYAAEGDHDEARKHYKLARPRLVALKHDHIIARCEEALGPGR